MWLTVLMVALAFEVTKSAVELKLFLDMEDEILERCSDWDPEVVDLAVDDVTHLHTLYLKQSVVTKVNDENYKENIDLDYRYMEVITASILENLGKGDAAPKNVLPSVLKQDTKDLLQSWKQSLESSSQKEEIKTNYKTIMDQMQVDLEQSTSDTISSVALRFLALEREVLNGFKPLPSSLIMDDDDDNEAEGS